MSQEVKQENEFDEALKSKQQEKLKWLEAVRAKWAIRQGGKYNSSNTPYESISSKNVLRDSAYESDGQVNEDLEANQGLDSLECVNKSARETEDDEPSNSNRKDTFDYEKCTEDPVGLFEDLLDQLKEVWLQRFDRMGK